MEQGNFETENGDQVNSAFNLWQETLKDVEFQGDKPKTPIEEVGLTPEFRGRESRSNIVETIRTLSSQEMEKSGEIPVRPKTEIICDHGHIEGQKIDVVNNKDRGIMEFRLKLRNPEEIPIPKIENQAEDAEVLMPSGTVLKRGKITYEGVTKYGSKDTYTLCDASVFEKNGVKVFVADPSSRDGSGINISIINNYSGLIRSAMGLVEMEAPLDMDPEETQKILGDILEQDLGIDDALEKVSVEAETEYKEARYKWQHAIAGELSKEQKNEAYNLSREEVFPGYTTLVEKDKYKKYLEKYGEDIRAVHTLHSGDVDSIFRALTQGLMSTTERYSRGILSNGMSSRIDMDTGGADNVFTRITNAARRERMYDTVVVLKPEIFDRTDWYAYNGDNFGSTDDSTFSHRLSPDAIFSKMSNPKEYLSSANEQMFRTGISADSIESIIVDAYEYDKTISGLRSMGLEEFNGKPIEEIVVSRNNTPPDGVHVKFGSSIHSHSPETDASAPSTPPSGEAEQFLAESLAEQDILKKWQEAEKEADKKAKEEAEKEEEAKWLEEFKKKQQEKQSKKEADFEAMVKGEKAYTSLDELFDLANVGENYVSSTKSLIESVVARGQKDQLVHDLKNYLKNEGKDELKALASGKLGKEYTIDDEELFSYLSNALGIDYGALYDEVLSLESAQNQDLAPTPTPETPPKKSYDDWTWDI